MHSDWSIMATALPTIKASNELLPQQGGIYRQGSSPSEPCPLLTAAIMQETPKPDIPPNQVLEQLLSCSHHLLEPIEQPYYSYLRNGTLRTMTSSTMDLFTNVLFTHVIFCCNLRSFSRSRIIYILCVVRVYVPGIKLQDSHCTCTLLYLGT